MSEETPTGTAEEDARTLFERGQRLAAEQAEAEEIEAEEDGTEEIELTEAEDISETIDHLIGKKPGKAEEQRARILELVNQLDGMGIELVHAAAVAVKLGGAVSFSPAETFIRSTLERYSDSLEEFGSGSLTPGLAEDDLVEFREDYSKLVAGARLLAARDRRAVTGYRDARDLTRTASEDLAEIIEREDNKRRKERARERATPGREVQ